ncbi:MAG: Do family serine endopeptidase [Terriglobales bacterium]
MNQRARAFLARFKAHRWASTFVVLLTLAVGILIGTVISVGVRGQDKGSTSSDATPLTIPQPKQMSNQFTKIAKAIEPAVVNINTESTIKNPHRRRMPSPNNPQGPGGPGGQGGPGDQDNPFQDFFDRFFGGQGGPDGTPMRQRSLGSGVIVDPKGYIVTNRHVVENADRIRVKLQDDPAGYAGHDAKVIGTDTETDLAVIKISDGGKPMPSAKLGNSDGMQVGDWVLAVGSPFGLNATVTAGIVSYIGRNIVPGRQFQSFIQTDAAINPGNSGGPLVNMEGEVIGINTAIITGGEGYEGVGFALPSKTVATVYNQLIGPEHRVTRGSIGVEFEAAPNPAVARVYGVKSGVTIANVVSGSPADQAGLKVGDTIVSVDGKPVKNGDELVSDISSRKPGSKATIGYIRSGKEATTSVTIANRAKLFASRLGGGEEEEGGEQGAPVESKLGVTVQNITPEMADRFGLPAGKGVVVSDVKSGSFADDVGINRGDVILEINKQPVSNESDFRRIQQGLKSGQDVVFLVRQGRGRNAGTIFLGGTLP